MIRKMKMLTEIEKVLPSEIEKRSFEIITEELGDKKLVPGTELIVKRCIHTSADFDYAENLCFSDGAVEKAMEAIRNGACIVTDTQMAKAGINKRALARYGGEVYCFMSDEDVAKMRESYDERRRFLVKELREMGMPCFEPMGAFYVFPNISRFGMTSEEFAKTLLEKEHVAVVPGSAFGTCGEGFLRISYAYSIEDLKKALVKIQNFIDTIS